MIASARSAASDSAVSYMLSVGFWWFRRAAPRGISERVSTISTAVIAIATSPNSAGPRNRARISRVTKSRHFVKSRAPVVKSPALTVRSDSGGLLLPLGAG